MSYNVTSMEVIECSLTMPRETFNELRESLNGQFPEWSLMEEYGDKYGESDEVFWNKKIRPVWCYEGSGSLMDVFKKEILPKTRGTAELVLIWEGGDDVSGIRVKDGVVTEHKVTYKLAD